MSEVRHGVLPVGSRWPTSPRRGRRSRAGGGSADLRARGRGARPAGTWQVERRSPPSARSCASAAPLQRTRRSPVSSRPHAVVATAAREAPGGRSRPSGRAPPRPGRRPPGSIRRSRTRRCGSAGVGERVATLHRRLRSSSTGCARSACRARSSRPRRTAPRRDGVQARHRRSAPSRRHRSPRAGRRARRSSPRGPTSAPRGSRRRGSA